MKKPLPELGLVCITCGPEVRYRTTTLARHKQFSEEEQKGRLADLYQSNLNTLLSALDFVHQEGWKLYRVTANLFPLSDLEDGLGKAILLEMQEQLAEVGQKAERLGIRVGVHPDQFVVLSSESERVIQNSVQILEHQGWLMDLLGLPRSSWAFMNIHGGKGGRGFKLVETIQTLSEGVKSRLTLENDEKIYSAREIFEACIAAGVPMVFDSHHHVVKEKLPSLSDPSIEQWVKLARETWSEPSWQLVHLSSGREGLHDSRHHDLILDFPEALWDAPWIEVEAKGKETALRNLKAALQSQV
ncbi:UV DNA damage repair endonuclease UvsE [Deinococcus roseus]|uniref:UV DNA damage repair endonuclease UvsE n=1 Tax=Deinococcus roseus TaxID=392414 RepID=UPI001E505BCB|nr:UV DNA damage repair endonuclease UvsE [Deinococcus roseus]